MSFRKQLGPLVNNKIQEELMPLLPSGYQRIGDIIILTLNSKLRGHEKAICDATMGLYCGIKTVAVKFDGVKGELRQPGVRAVSGNGTETIHRENGCRYMLDVAKVMFAKGNSRERGRLPSIVRKGETVIDMFAGIGYFTIPIATKSRPSNIISIEKNPDSAEYLGRNVMLNKAANVHIIHGDCREAGLEGQADRIVMGYLPGTERFLPAAFRMLKDRGTIHYHNTYPKDGLWDKPVQDLEKAAEKAGYRLDNISYKGVVKQYSPSEDHVVIDAIFKKKLK